MQIDRSSQHSNSQPSGSININNFFKKLVLERNVPQFHILEYVYPRKSAYFSPYMLKYSTNRECEYFLMITERGVVYIDNEEYSYTKLDEWYHEYQQFEQLQNLKIFQKFRLWKSFYLWRKLIKNRKFVKAATFLEDNLFMLNSHLREDLLEIHERLLTFQKLNFVTFVDVSNTNDYDVYGFIDRQIERFRVVFGTLKTFRDWCKDTVLQACLKTLYAEGFVLNENLRRRRMSYSIRVSNITNPLFVTHLVIEEEEDCEPILKLRPSYENFNGIFAQLLITWEDNMQNFEILLPDPYFKGFTYPIIDGRPQDRVCGNGPNFQFYLQSDHIYQNRKTALFDGIEVNFEQIHNYLNHFGSVMEFYCQDLRNNGVLESHLEDSLDLLQSLCSKYSNEIEIVQNLSHFKDMALMKLEMFDYFVQKILPEPQRLLDSLRNRLPVIGRQKMKDLFENIADMFTKLNYEPNGSDAIVEYLELMEATVPKITHIESCYTYLTGLYALMATFHISVLDDDDVKLNNVQNSVLVLRDLVRQKVLLKDDLVHHLESSLKSDAIQLEHKVIECRNQLLEKWLIDKNSDRDAIRDILTKLQTELEDDKNIAVKLQNYQKEFKLEISRFQVLDEVLNELHLRELLWNSVDQWTHIMSEYFCSKFQELNVEDMLQNIGKYGKIATQLEKAFGADNCLVMELKSGVEMFKSKMPVLSALRHQNLCQRHWVCIEKILGHKMKLDQLTLDDFEQFDVYQNGDEFNEIAALASSEAALEVMLMKIEDLWQNLEFIVLQHRGAKDVYILGPVEDIQVVLDETIITMNTIASSKYVGFLKHQVDQWLRKIDLFERILDQWLYFQQNWLYLESIFTAPDIQRQLATEAASFNNVDRFWKKLMRLIVEVPTVLNCLNIDNLYENFVKNNAQLDQILKCIEKYLETKRVAFPRFYFLSNDELLEILAQTRNPQAVQSHLRKCFDAINRLEFGRQPSNDIVAMISPEGEYVEFIPKGLKARGNVEDWLGKVEEAMFHTMRKILKLSLDDYGSKGRMEWLKCYPSQIILVVSQIMWAAEVHSIFIDSTKNPLTALKQFETKLIGNLNDLAALVRRDLDPILRKIIVALITVDVHARDTISSLIENSVDAADSFVWLKMLRYYWEDDECFAKMSNACYSYGYEYLGATGCLVITPLTDKCYLCLMGALQMDLGGAPSGPAGTGKTETTKDLAKSLAVQCVVFNCSDDLDFKMMGRFFSGLAQCGSWCCFDEFNRIDIEVLSVIAQQLITIKNAKAAHLDRFVFENREIKLVRTCAAFITMNPGYAGRTELPDNLKSLFRPISMMVPDYAIIAEVTLYSEGFEQSKTLAHKMVQMYKLCSEQLSQQDHYDFGMRAVKSVLVTAGQLKRSQPHVDENVVLICALRDSNLPKFLKDDTVLFSGILNDLFPGVSLPEATHDVLEQAIIYCMANVMDLTVVPNLVRKCIQLHETLNVRWGVMLVGPTGGGKSTVLRMLQEAYNHLGDDFKNAHTHILNPKSISIEELYGEINPYTLEWKDGLLGSTIRNATQYEGDQYQWIVCDGPVDAAWIENLNTVLDDNKMLCLANSERIKLTSNIRMIFEVQDLAQASPATVSRCGMVYVDPDDLKWLPYVRQWLLKVKTYVPESFREEISNHLLNLFESYVEFGFKFVQQFCQCNIPQVDIGKIKLLCTLLESFIQKLVDKKSEKAFSMEMTNCDYLSNAFLFSYLWSIGGNLVEDSKEKFGKFVCNQMNLNLNLSLWDLYVSEDTGQLTPWLEIIPDFVYDIRKPYFETIVPTIDTVRFSKIMGILLNLNHPVLVTGGTGVGKSVISKSTLEELGHLYCIVNFSAQTSSQRIQEILESKLEKRKRTHLAPPAGKKFIMFLDDVNMPKLDTYGSQPPIELLRQYLDYGGLYDREKLFWKSIRDLILAAACSPPGSGGRNAVSARFLRHFAILEIPVAKQDSLQRIFGNILRGFFQDFTPTIQNLCGGIVNCAIDLYNRIMIDLLPTPEKSHYVFNLRDLSKCVQGLLQANSNVYLDKVQILRLFYHESLRVFHDRLVDDKDQAYFYDIMEEVSLKHLDMVIVDKGTKLMFGDFMNVTNTMIATGGGMVEKIYEEIQDYNKVREVLQEYLDDFNTVYNKEIKLVFFLDAIEYCVRIARILRSERGHALLVGVGGMGKRSLTRLAAHLNGFKCFQIELSRNYDHSAFLDDLRKLYYVAGVKNENTVFLLTDTQIIHEEFLEDINNILNSGQVPNLFEGEELEKVLMAVRSMAAREAGISEVNRDAIFEYFINRVRANLHLVLCLSPIGPNFRHWCRMFPSLVNCCTINWFFGWPNEALCSVAEEYLVEFDDKAKLAEMCVLMHKNVEDMSEKYYKEAQRHNYVTPNSFLELLKLYQRLYFEKRDNFRKSKEKLLKGLAKLDETNRLVDKMKFDLKAMEPLLANKSENSVRLLAKLKDEKEQVDAVRSSIKVDESEAQKQAEITQSIAADAESDLKSVMPVYESATKALEALNKNDINELKAFQKPPILVQFVTEAVCILLNSKTDWSSAKILLTDVNFLKRLKDYDKNNISEKTLQKLKAYIDHKDFRPEIVAKTSKVCKSICMWVRAIDTYAKVYKLVEPKIERQREAERQLLEVMTLLRRKQEQLALVEDRLRQLESVYDQSMVELTKLQDTVDLTAKLLNHANKLTTALEDEEIRWGETVKKLDGSLSEITGDILLAAGCISYLGPFSDSYRNQLIDSWLGICAQLKISACQNFNFVSVLSSNFEMRTWNTFGLPRDQVSTENAVLATKSSRWPLMIDPQEQANRWIRSMESTNGLRLIKQTDANFVIDMKHSILTGNPVLLEEVGEHLDAILDGVLLKQTFVHSGRTLIRFADSDIEYDSNFRLYITTKLSNPHYLPEVSTKVTLINFTVTPSGLEDQLLADVVRVERPDLEIKRSELVIKINSDKMNLESFEDKILKLLFSSSGNILDDEELIHTLNECKETSTVIATRLQESETVEEKITVARNRYRPAATRGSLLYFTIAKLVEIDPMYQFSLKYFNQLFNSVIETSERSDYVTQRLDTLCNQSTKAIFKNVSRALFDNHKLIFSFTLCVDILSESGSISADQMAFLLSSRSRACDDLVKNPYKATVSDELWFNIAALMNKFDTFRNFDRDLMSSITITIGDFQYIYRNGTENRIKCNENWDRKLNNVEKLLLIRALQEDKLLTAIVQFIKINLGTEFVENEPILLKNVYRDTTKTTPLIFILSSGSDPLSAFQKFATDSGFAERYQTVSLGQGQGPVAEKLIDNATKRGHWVFLQNCHLATSWMLSLEKLVASLPDKEIHNDFRLFLSSMPTKSFPISVLQNSVKVTNEVPKGLRSNLLRAFNEFSDNYLSAHNDSMVWKQLIFGLCMFHAIIIERKRYGPLGWNIPYEFNDNDRECALKIVEMFTQDFDHVSWDALDYILGEITYGGRVTDAWDLRCLKTILKGFLTSSICRGTSVCKYSKSGTYYCPESDFVTYITQLPLSDAPDIFGMHENANMVFELTETRFVCETVLNYQEVGAKLYVSSVNNDEIVLEMIAKIRSLIVTKIEYDNCRKELFCTDRKGRLASLTTVLIQEIDRYNRFISSIHDSLENVRKSIKGLNVMSETLEQIYYALVHNRVPRLWSKKAYPSLKSLSVWIIDLKHRLDFIQDWLNFGTPNSFWFSGLYFPQGFLTGVLQTYARNYHWPIDELQFDFAVKSQGMVGDEIKDAVLIHGLFLESGDWDRRKSLLIESKMGQLISDFPAIYLIPSKKKISLKPTDYLCPMYKTAVRAGTLSTTGHSTNFVLGVHLPTDNFNEFWVLQGTALLTQLP